MKVAILIEVEDQLLTEYVQAAYVRYEGTVPWMDPADWLRDRLQAFADDELRQTFYGWYEQLGMRVTVSEVEPSLPW